MIIIIIIIIIITTWVNSFGNTQRAARRFDCNFQGKLWPGIRPNLVYLIRPSYSLPVATIQDFNLFGTTRVYLSNVFSFRPTVLVGCMNTTDGQTAEHTDHGVVTSVVILYSRHRHIADASSDAAYYTIMTSETVAIARTDMQACKQNWNFPFRHYNALCKRKLVHDVRLSHLTIKNVEYW